MRWSHIPLEYVPFLRLAVYATLFLYFHSLGLCIFYECFEALKCTASRKTFARYSAQTNVNRRIYVVHANRKISQQPANGTTDTRNAMQMQPPPFMATYSSHATKSLPCFNVNTLERSLQKAFTPFFHFLLQSVLIYE